MNDQRFSKIGRIIDALGCAVDEAEESAVSLQHAGKPTAKAVWNGAADIRDRLREISDAADSLYRECEADYVEDEELVDTAVYALVLNRLPRENRASPRGDHGYWFPKYKCVEI